MLYLVTLTVALAGPMPMFGRAPTSPTPAPTPVPPTSRVGVPFPFAFGATVGPPVAPEAPSPPETPFEAFPARLPYVEAAPIKTKVARPGVPVPIDQLPDAFRPIPQAENRLPVVTVRPVTPASE